MMHHAAVHTSLHVAPPLQFRRGACRKCCTPRAQSAPNHHDAEPQEHRLLLSRRAAATAALVAVAAPLPVRAGLASYDVTNKGIREVSMALGDKSNALAYIPSELSFEQGQVTKLTLTNPSQVEHYFSAREFASKVFTIAVESKGVEVKGAVTEVALEPGASLTWIFVPMKAGSYQLLCPVPGHIEGGMVGVLTVTAAR